MNKECLELKKIVKMCFAQIKDRRFSELKILLEIKREKCQVSGSQFSLHFVFQIDQECTIYISKSWKIISWTNFFVLQLTIIYFPKFREDHPGFRR